MSISSNKYACALQLYIGTRKSYQTLNEGGTSVHYDGSKEHTASLILSGESNSKSEPKVITLEAEKWRQAIRQTFFCSIIFHNEWVHIINQILMIIIDLCEVPTVRVPE